ncbi:2'-5' RNA ligase family protein [Aureimonas psammosilenae]|uniref:2'-5' RNA ligase family protein n=1 Tax=Aureimonas psammosilenae TaxID=2495496 RepID=UPI0012607FE0|nr:2'-5' RNA ligase family protein [Aureimonas psammosilenae]
MTGAPAPLILTLGFDERSFAFFDEARRRYFPPERNHIPAHLTLFHHLPGEDLADIAATLREVTVQMAALPLRVSGLVFLGYGSAYRLESPELTQVRKDLAARWAGRLTPQDAAGFRPHVTVQNKAPSREAKQLFAELQAGFQPFEATGTGLLLWHYRGGPWEAAGEFPFAAP